jgi:hypothetical protein
MVIVIAVGAFIVYRIRRGHRERVTEEKKEIP